MWWRKLLKTSCLPYTLSFSDYAIRLTQKIGQRPNQDEEHKAGNRKDSQRNQNTADRSCHRPTRHCANLTRRCRKDWRRTRQLACGICVVVCKALYRSRPVQRPSDYFSCVPEKDLTLVEFAIGAEFGGYGWRWKGVD